MSRAERTRRPPDPDDARDAAADRERDRAEADRGWGAWLYYESLRWLSFLWLSLTGGLRATGRDNIPATGGALLVANHTSFLDVFVMGVPLRRPLNYVARSTLFLPGFGLLLRGLGGFPIQRDGMGASGLKETLRRLRRGGVVILFPEGTRSRDGRLGELKAGIAVLAQKSRVPVVPSAAAGTFEAWPRHHRFPGVHAIRVHYGPPILPEEIAGLPAETVTRIIHDRIDACLQEARRALARDLQRTTGDGRA